MSFNEPMMSASDGKASLELADCCTHLMSRSDSLATSVSMEAPFTRAATDIDAPGSSAYRFRLTDRGSNHIQSFFSSETFSQDCQEPLGSHLRKISSHGMLPSFSTFTHTGTADEPHCNSSNLWQEHGQQDNHLQQSNPLDIDPNLIYDVLLPVTPTPKCEQSESLNRITHSTPLGKAESGKTDERAQSLGPLSPSFYLSWDASRRTSGHEAHSGKSILPTTVASPPLGPQPVPSISSAAKGAMHQQSKLEMLRLCMSGADPLPSSPLVSSPLVLPHIPAFPCGMDVASLPNSFSSPDRLDQLSAMFGSRQQSHQVHPFQVQLLQLQLEQRIQRALLQEALLQKQMSMVSTPSYPNETSGLCAEKIPIETPRGGGVPGWSSNNFRDGSLSFRNSLSQEPLSSGVENDRESKTDIIKAHQRTQFFRTRLCPHLFSKRKFCKRQMTCNYAHSEGELRPSINLTRTKLCQEFVGGNCSNADCRFAHGARELRSTPTFFKTLLCKYWSAGFCPSGPGCRHAHGDEERLIAAAGSAGVFGQGSGIRESFSEPFSYSGESLGPMGTEMFERGFSAVETVQSDFSDPLGSVEPTSRFSFPLFLPRTPQVAPRSGNEKKKIGAVGNRNNFHYHSSFAQYSPAENDEQFFPARTAGISRECSSRF